MEICTAPWNNAAKSNRAGTIASLATVREIVKTATDVDISLFTTQTDSRLIKIAGVATVRDAVKFAAEKAVIIVVK